MSGEKVVVLGANAFSGQDFIDLLLDDPTRKVTGISRSAERPAFFLRYRRRSGSLNYRFFQIDMNDGMESLLRFLDEEKPDWIVNFAAQSEVAPSWDHPEHWFQTNTVSLARLVNHLSRIDYLQRYLHISSPEAYGSCEGSVKEGTPDNPSTPYAASKAAADMLLKVYHEHFGFPLLTVRATNVYGARQQLFKIMPRTVIYVRSGRKIQLHGGGTAVKSYIHVRDVSRGELAILEKGKIGGLYHLSPERGIAVRDVVAAICRKMGADFDDAVEVVGERLGQDAVYWLESGLARTSLDWAPQIAFDDGISELADWIDENWTDIQDYELEYIHKP